MKKSLFLLFLLPFFHPDSFSQCGTWSYSSLFSGGARGNAVAFSVGSYGYVATGNTTNAMDDTWQYDPSANAWTQMADTPGGPRENAVAVSLNGYGYVGLGVDGAGNPHYDFHRFDPSSNTWAPLTTYPGTGIFKPTGFALAGNIFIGTGEDAGGASTSEFYRYDPSTGNWSTIASFPIARQGATAFSLGRRGYVCAGYSNPLSSNLNDLWEYDYYHDIWIARESLPGIPRNNPNSFVIRNKAYVGVGFNSGTQKDFYKYHPCWDHWVRIEDYGGLDRSNAVGFSIDTIGYVGLGFSLGNGKQPDFYEYVPGKTYYLDSDGDGVGLADSSEQACVKPSGYALYYGDCAPFDPNISPIQKEKCSNSIDDNCDGLVDATDVWTSKAPFGGSPRSGAVSFSVYRKGYTGLGGSFNNDLWEYDPVANAWEQKAEYPAAGKVGAVAFSINGAGYVIGGEDGSGIISSSSYRYFPCRNVWDTIPDIPDPKNGGVGFAIGGKGFVGLGENTSGRTKTFYRFDPLSNSWSQVSDWPGTERIHAVSFTLSGKAFVGTGRDASGNRADVHSYDPSSDSWTTVTPHPGKRVYGVGFSVRNRGFVGLGEDGGGLTDLWEYRVQSSEWVKRASFPGSASAAATTFSIWDRAFVATGRDVTTSTTTDEVYEYSPPSAPQVYLGPDTSFCMGGYVVLNAGFPGSSYNWSTGASTQKINVNSTGTYWVEVTDSATNCVASDTVNVSQNNACVTCKDTWKKLPDFPGPPMMNPAGFALGDTIYFGIGMTAWATSYSDEFWGYDPSSGTWTQMANFGGSQRRNAVSFSIGGVGYVSTGFDNSSGYLNDLWAYDPGTNTWSQRAPLPSFGREKANAFTILGKAYLVGGDTVGTASGYIGECWEYDPSTDSWTQMAPYGGTPRANPASFVIDSFGYVGTGRDIFNNFRKDFWRFDPNDGTQGSWTFISQLPGPVRDNGTGFAVGQRGYVFAGNYPPQVRLKDVYEYDPYTDTWTQLADFPGLERRMPYSVSTDHTAYIMGGSSDNSNPNPADDFWVFRPSLQVDPLITHETCAGACDGIVELKLTGGVPPFTYKWSNGNSSRISTGFCPGTYQVVVEDSIGCSDSLTVTIDSSSFSHSIQVDRDTVYLCEDESDTLKVSGGIAPTWSPTTGLSASVSSSPEVTYKEDIMYVVRSVDSNGCVATDSLWVLLAPADSCGEIRIYNAFSPDGDGVNDVWTIDGIQAFPKNSVTIFNRWGDPIKTYSPYDNKENVWKGNGPGGNLLPAGTYFYLIEPGDGETDPLKGWVYLDI